MKARGGTVAWLLVGSLVMCGWLEKCAFGQDGAASTKATAKVLVWVRDGRGAPVAGLTADDFAVTENGEPDRVVGVEKFFKDAPAVERTKRPVREVGWTDESGVREKSWVAKTQVLILMEPMSLAGRYHALKEAEHYLERPDVQRWHFALLDDTGDFQPYGQSAAQLRATLKRVEKHFSESGGSWLLKAWRAIGDLGILPGRHVIVLISDRSAYISASSFIESAVRAQASLYTIESLGPRTVVPGGAAADMFPTDNVGPFPFPLVGGEGAGQDLRDDLWVRGYLVDDTDFVRAAEESGGLAVNGLKDAFEHIAADSAGYYLLSFEANPNERDGTWHPFSVALRRSNLKVRGPRYYLVPLKARLGPIPAEMKAALELPGNSLGLHMAANAWLFPDHGGVHWGAFGADLRWEKGAPAAGSRVKISAEMISANDPTMAGTWFEEIAWREAGSGPFTVHWQREAPIYPGTYLLRVLAMDTASGKVAKATYNFAARPLDLPAFRFSSIVLADGCLTDTESAPMRRNMFDPLLWEGCKLAPSAEGRFRASQTPTVLVRLYPPNAKMAKLVTSQWKAYAVVDDAEDKANPLQIAAAEVRGITVSGKLMLSRMDLKPGPHKLTVLFTANGEHGKTTHIIPLQAEFSIEP